MNSTKRFLILYAITYIVIATGFNMTLGPPAMSKDYMAEFKADHNRYIEAIKNKEYKVYVQRPDLIDLDAEENAALKSRAEFVAEYVTRPRFLKEEARRSRYGTLFDIFNTLMVVVLVGRFARKPLGGFIDGMIEAIRLKIKDAEDAKQQAAQRLHDAEGKIKGLPLDLAGYEKLVEERIEIIRRDSALFTGESVSILNKETEDRKRFEVVKAQHQMKEQMVDAAIEQVIASIKSADSAEADEQTIDQFIANMQERRS